VKILIHSLALLSSMIFMMMVCMTPYLKEPVRPYDAWRWTVLWIMIILVLVSHWMGIFDTVAREKEKK
jgi:hypothetical protein